jgi:hypothetical protein
VSSASPRALVRSLLARFGIAVLLFTVLMLPFTGLARGYAGFFRAVLGPAVDLVFPVELELTPFHASTGTYSAAQMHDTAMVVTHPPHRLQNPITSLWLGYVPTALFIALLVPTPIPGRRKRRALWIGLALVQLFVALRLAILMIDILSRPTPAALFHPGPRLLDAITFTSQMVTSELFPSFLVPLMIWALVSFRAEDLARWRVPTTVTL